LRLVPAITGATRLAAVIGDPARHSLSPTIHNAAFAACDLDWVYLAFDVATGDAGPALAAMRTLGIAGLSVTMPHKAAVAAAVDVRSATADALGAVNCVVNRDGVLFGDNTDGEGFLRGLQTDAGLGVAGLRCVVLGAGGAARAVVDALARAGATEVVVVNRSHPAARVAAALAGDAGRVGAIDDVAGAQLVVNATPLGMTAHDPRALPCPPALVAPGAVAVDLVYQPLETAWLRALRTRDVRGFNGVSMLVHQAARQFELWTGVAAPISAMHEAVADHLRIAPTNH
jgi:shikimate dehydrogenase